MFHTQFYRLLISVILVTLLLPASFVQADSFPSTSPQTNTPPADTQALCPPYSPEHAQDIQQVPPECQKVHRKEILSARQAGLQVASLGTGGPDAFGYTYDDSAAYTWIDASTPTGLTGDDEASVLDIGFTFPFYGMNHSQLYFNTNGLITFGSANSGFGGEFLLLPAAPNNLIAPFWDDLVVGAADGNPAGGIYYQLFGSAPNRYLVLEWRNVDLWMNPAVADFSFEAILHENGDIKIQYKSLPSDEYFSSVGIENSLGLDGLQYQWGTYGLSASTAVLFTYPTIPAARVLLSPLEQGGFAILGGTKIYTLQVANTGNTGADTYNLTTNSSWPAAFYASDGLTELTDTDGDATIDTGPIAQGNSIDLVVKFSAPGDAQVGDKNSATLTATSTLDAGQSQQVTLYTTIPASFASVFVDENNFAMSLMTASRLQSNTYKVTADDYSANYPSLAMIRLENGSYLYAWYSVRDNGYTIVSEIEYAIVRANGSLVRGVTRLTNLSTATLYTVDDWPSLSVAPNGTVGVVWRRYVYNFSNNTRSANIFFATLDSTGKLVTGPASITSYGMSNSSSSNVNYPTIAATDDNRFLLGWEYFLRNSSGENYNVYVAGRSTAGANVFPPKAFTSNNQSFGPILNSLAGGRAILLWSQGNGGPYYAVLNSSGTTAMAATNLNTPYNYRTPDAVLLPNGKTAVAWITNQGVEYSILNSSYNIENGPHLAPYNPPQGYSSNQYDLSVTTDADSRVIMSWLDGSDYQSLVYALGDSAGNYLTLPMPYKSSSISINTSRNGQGIAPFGYSTDISIGATPMGRYEVLPENSLVQTFASIQNGPVKVKSPEGKKLFASERVISGSSFNEVMGFPNNQLTTEYWFPWYENKTMATWILVGNPTTTAAKVDIYVAGVKRTSAATIPAGGRITPRYAGVQGGPVRVVSTNGVKIFASERATYGPDNAFNEMMGYPANQLTTEYWFPWYDNVSMATWLLVGNPSTTSAARVDIYIGGAKKGSYTIAKGANIAQRFTGLQAGPVRVVSTNNVPIITSERTIYANSFNEVMGSPANQFTTEHFYPWYDNQSMATWLLVGNPSTTTAANVDIYIGGVKRGSYSIPKGGRITPRFSLDAGPVRVVSTNGVKIFTSERVLYNGAFNEVMGYPGNKLDTLYWFPWYDSTTMSTDIVVGMP